MIIELFVPLTSFAVKYLLGNCRERKSMECHQDVVAPWQVVSKGRYMRVQGTDSEETFEFMYINPVVCMSPILSESPHHEVGHFNCPRLLAFGCSVGGYPLPTNACCGLQAGSDLSNLSSFHQRRISALWGVHEQSDPFISIRGLFLRRNRYPRIW